MKKTSSRKIPESVPMVLCESQLFREFTLVCVMDGIQVRVELPGLREAINHWINHISYTEQKLPTKLTISFPSDFLLNTCRNYHMDPPDSVWQIEEEKEK